MALFKFKSISILTLVLLSTACGAPEPGSGDSTATGGYQAHLVFPEGTPRPGRTTQALSVIDCDELDIAEIQFNFILNGNQYGPHFFDCEEHHATISGVPAGKGVIVEVFADDSDGEAVYEGSEVVDIVPDEVTPGGDVQMLATVAQTPGGGFFIRALDMQFESIPSGSSFNMGSLEEEEDPEGYSDERPRHPVRFAQSYYMQATEVTQDQYRKIMGANPSHFSNCGGTCPVERVSWEDAKNFIGALNERVAGGYTFRLPTEAEWEYAARAGMPTAYYFGDTLTKAQANFESDGPMPVKHFPQNALGLYDMHGNVWEWVEDDWHENYQDAPSNGIAWIYEHDRGDYRVLRGGSWIYEDAASRSANRYQDTPGFRNYSYGFRLASSLDSRSSGRLRPQAESIERGVGDARQ